VWSAVRSIEEQALLMRRLAEHVGRHEDGGGAEFLLQNAQDTLRRAELVKQATLKYGRRGGGGPGRTAGEA
jgi:hypothetical protein